MAEQIYQKTFYAHRNTFYEDKDDARRRVLEDANEFFINHDSFSVINIIESWNESENNLQLTIYYKDYI